ncbi:hypothetical protein Sm713_63120 [Streptomyces sp. TS71-3]|nr:hypothetical protein Sm713_63120 [Streptomyces sp. TS71-3]
MATLVTLVGPAVDMACCAPWVVVNGLDASRAGRGRGGRRPVWGAYRPPSGAVRTPGVEPVVGAWWPAGLDPLAEEGAQQRGGVLADAGVPHGRRDGRHGAVTPGSAGDRLPSGAGSAHSTTSVPKYRSPKSPMPGCM